METSIYMGLFATISIYLISIISYVNYIHGDK